MIVCLLNSVTSVSLKKTKWSKSLSIQLVDAVQRHHLLLGYGGEWPQTSRNSVLRRKGRLDAKSYGNANRMGKKKQKRKKRWARGGRREEEEILWWSAVGGQKGEQQVGTMCGGGAVHEKEYFHSSTGLEWDMCPGISKTRLVTSRPRGRSLGSQDTKGSQFVIFLSSTAVTTPLKCD